MFSSRLPPSLQPNRLAKAPRPEKLIDLTQSNPTVVSLPYEIEAILQALRDKRNLLYLPDPKGLLSARQTIAGYYHDKYGAKFDAENVFLTASTSEAYALLFKLLCNAGDCVLVPAPSYPLFEHLCRAEAVRTLQYRLYYDGSSWRIDFNSLKSAIQPNTRAIVVVSPNNPTGSCINFSELQQLIEICNVYDVAIICDEVFADYCYNPAVDRVTTVAGNEHSLTFALGGLSKLACLPQLKLGWIIVSGRKQLASEAITRLEFLCDLYLSVSSPVQHALGKLIDATQRLRCTLLTRLKANRQLISKLFASSAVSLLASEGGWYACLRVPHLLDEEEMVLELLKRSLLVHPGYFFDFEMQGILVVSLLPEASEFALGIEKLKQFLDEL
ncbi:MAG: pyridoxal phosphate-dependent aminotransferase [Acidobacteriota bacterium]|nr:pyridoxal phosphate-dependent aminotransferase [Blastocatellia bacterium]MDW8411814.1 pyridoxal phosphate-dependent aminotransferase [Acidobacteriota bacterium]